MKISKSTKTILWVVGIGISGLLGYKLYKASKSPKISDEIKEKLKSLNELITQYLTLSNKKDRTYDESMSLPSIENNVKKLTTELKAKVESEIEGHTIKQVDSSNYEVVKK